MSLKRIILSAALFLPLLLFAAGSGQKTDLSNINLKINGAVVYDVNKDGNTFGIYSFKPRNPVTREAVKLIPWLSANGGAILFGGKYYTFDYTIGSGYASGYYTTYDAVTWEKLVDKSAGYDAAAVYANAALSCAQDPVTGIIYCSGYEYDAAGGSLSYILSTWDLDGMTKQKIAAMERPMQVMGCTKDGTLYGISSNTASQTNNGGILYKIDKTTGILTKVGDTGVDPKFFQSAVINPKDDTFYWFANEEDESANLYTVNLSTGEAVKIGKLPYGEQVVGAYIPAPEANDDAPSGALNFTVDFLDGALDGKVVFDVPDYTYAGQVLTGEVKYTVKANGAEAASGTSSPGEKVTAGFSVSAGGSYNISVVLSNNAGDSPTETTEIYIGKDKPLAPQNITLTRENSINTVSWEAPAGTENGGYMNVEDLTYKVTRMPGNVVVKEKLKAATYSEMFDSDELAVYYYNVTAFNDTIEGASANSNAIKIGEALDLPYSQDFTDKTSLDLYTIIDVNGDKSTWAYSSGKVSYRYNSKNVADDWLITPPLRLVAGNKYVISYDVYALNARSPEKLEVKMGKTATADGMTNCLMEEKEYTNTSREPLTETVTVIPEADGIYYIGFHAVSNANMGNLNLDNLKVEVVSPNVPGAVTELKVEPAAQGVLSATISFVTPSLNSVGSLLTSLSSIEISRNGKLVETIESTEKGKTIEWTDKSPVTGTNSYSVVAVNSFGSGDSAESSAYIGIDIPLAPVNVVFADLGNGNGSLSWDKVADVGIHNGYVDVSAVTYEVYDEDNKLVDANVSGNTCALTGLNKELPQVLASYTVYAKNSIGKSETGTASNNMLVGPAYEAPYVEKFVDAKVTKGPWTVEILSGGKYDSGWTIRPDQSKEEDGGSADFGGYAVGAVARIYSPKIDVSHIAKPRLVAWVLIPGGGAKITVQISENYGEWQDISTVEQALEWTLVNIDLSSCKSGNIRVAFMGECLKDYMFAYVDNVELRSFSESNLKAVSMDGPPFGKINEESVYIVSVFNEGITTVNDFIVNLVDGDDNIVVSESVESLAAQTSADIKLHFTPSVHQRGSLLTFTGKIESVTDEDLSDNVTGPVSTQIRGSEYPVVSGLTGGNTGQGVELTWNAPDMNIPQNEEVTEEFEKYDPFTINGFGDWTVFDADGGETFVFGEVQNYWPNAGQPQAFMIMDVAASYFQGLGVDKNFRMDKKHGTKLAVCWSANSTTTKEGHNDDWLISPRLAQIAQTVTFEALRYSPLYGNESFEVYYSTTGNTTECFTHRLGQVDSVSYEKWTEYEYQLPADASYFAIRCTTKDGFLLGIDNVNFVPEPVLPEDLFLVNYNVYRNGGKIATVPTPGYIDIDPKKGEDNVYAISVMYNAGESNLSNTVTVFVSSGTGWNEISDVKVYSIDNNIIVHGAEGLNVRVTDLGGIVIYNREGKDYNKIPLSAGAYIVQVADKTVKVIVK